MALSTQQMTRPVKEVSDDHPPQAAQQGHLHRKPSGTQAAVLCPLQMLQGQGRPVSQPQKGTEPPEGM